MNFATKLARTTDGHYQVSIPDLPGCQLKALTVEEGLSKIKQVIADHLAILAEYNEPIPNARSIDAHVADNSELNIIWSLTEIDITPYLGKSHKINVTLPELLIKQIDDRVSKDPQSKTRSGFIAQACIAKLRNN